MNPYRANTIQRGSWWQRLKCRFGWCFKELVRVEDHELFDLWVQECPYCHARSEVADDGEAPSRFVP
jgi:hypothetical protein